MTPILLYFKMNLMSDETPVVEVVTFGSVVSEVEVVENAEKTHTCTGDDESSRSSKPLVQAWSPRRVILRILMCSPQVVSRLSRALVRRISTLLVTILFVRRSRPRR